MKTSFKKGIAIFLCSILLIALFTGCSSNTSSTLEEPASSGVEESKEERKNIEKLVVGTTMAIEAASRSDYYFDVLSGTLSQMALVAVDEIGKYQPLMATFETKDSKTWTFKIMEGLTWHDGAAVTANDVAFTLEYLEEQNDGGYRANYEDVIVLDNQTIQLVLPQPNARALSSLTTMRIIPKHIYEGVEDMASVTEDLATIGCGPYKFVRFDRNAGVIEFTANREYAGGIPNVNTIIYKLYGNSDTMYMALKSEEIDMVYYYAGGVEASGAEDLAAKGNITLSTVKDTSNTAVVVFNNNNEPGNNILIRKAIAKAINYDKFRELFGSEYSTPSTVGFVPLGSTGYIETDRNTRDLDGARAYLAEAGAQNIDGDGILEYKGAPLEIELLVRSDIPIYGRYAELLQANLKEVGISLKLKVLEVPEFRAITESEHTHQAMITKFTAYGMGMGAGMGTSYLDGRLSSNAQGQIMDEKFSRIVDRLRSSVSMEEYRAVAKECQQYYAETIPAIALYWDVYIQAYNKKLEGFVTDGTFGILNMATWFTLTEKI